MHPYISWVRGGCMWPYTTQPAPRGQEGPRRALDKESEGLSSSLPLTLTIWGPKEQSLLNPTPSTHTNALRGRGSANSHSGIPRAWHVEDIGG